MAVGTASAEWVVMRIAILGLAFLSLAACSAADANTGGDDPSEVSAAEIGSGPIPNNLYAVSPCAEPCTETMATPAAPGATLYRGAQPSANQIRYLRDTLHVKTIVDLQMTFWDVRNEQNYIDAVNGDGKEQIEWISYKMDPLTTPSDEKINEILAVFADPDKQPVYVHCSLGRDRTGLLVALHRTLNEGWDVQNAYNEWHLHGYAANEIERVGFGALADYLEERAGSFTE